MFILHSRYDNLHKIACYKYNEINTDVKFNNFENICSVVCRKLPQRIEESHV